MRRNVARLVLSLLPLVACSGDDGAAGVPGVLVRTAPDPSCANGTKLDIGPDENGNGQLDADEVTSSQSICNGAVTLTTASETAASAKCPGGAVTVKSGADTNKNGVLDDSEVTSANEICAAGIAELTKTTPLPEGDIACPFGGVVTERGADDGKNGGTAKDGILQPSEVLATTTTCVYGSGTSTTLAPPPGPVGTSTFRITGGKGTAGAGGAGRPFACQNGGGGPIKIWKTGKANAAFTMPVEVPAFGATKLDLVANTTIQNRTSSTEAANGEYYVLSGSALLYRQNDGNREVPVTGVHVAPGVTLTFAEATNIALSGDFHNEGTITTARAAGSARSLSFTLARYLGSAGSKIALNGEAGGAGGNLLVLARRIVNAGSIDTSGSSNGSGAGGGAGSVQLLAELGPQAGPLVSTGTLKANGGFGVTPGPAGLITLRSSTKGVLGSGPVESNGADGVNLGGSGAGVTFVSSRGPLRWSGAVSSRGGKGLDGSGGAAGAVQVYASGGDVAWDGDVFVNGGEGVMQGGLAAWLSIQAADGFDPSTGLSLPAGSIGHSGSIDARGGDGPIGGGGISGVQVSVSALSPGGQTIEMFGLAAIDTSGGDGTTAGGAAGMIALTSSAGMSVGPILVHASLLARGGKATTSGSGGPGALVAAQSGTAGTLAVKTSAVVIAGAVDASGGDGVTAGGTSGQVGAFARERIGVFGPLTSRGGSATAASGQGGSAAPMLLDARGDLRVEAPLATGGGNASGTGGSGGHALDPVRLLGRSVVATAAISTTGGNSNGTTGGSTGGIVVDSTAALASVSTLVSTAGTGTPNGARGPIVVDGITLP